MTCHRHPDDPERVTGERASPAPRRAADSACRNLGLLHDHLRNCRFIGVTPETEGATVALHLAAARLTFYSDHGVGAICSIHAQVLLPPVAYTGGGRAPRYTRRATEAEWHNLLFLERSVVRGGYSMLSLSAKVERMDYLRRRDTYLLQLHDDRVSGDHLADLLEPSSSFTRGRDCTREHYYCDPGTSNPASRQDHVHNAPVHRSQMCALSCASSMRCCR